MSKKKKTSATAPISSPPAATSVKSDGAAWSRFDAMFALLVCAATFLSFLPSLKNGFVGWDDSGMFLENVEYRGLKWENIKWMFTTFHYAHYHPITWLTLGLDYKIWGMNPKGYHLTSLIIHSFNAMLFYFFIRMVINTGRETPPRGAVAPALFCAIGTLFWSIHPLRVESVAWATERRDVLSGFFYLLTLIAYLKAQTNGPKTRWLVASLIFFLLSFLSKAWGITLPLVLLVLDVYPLKRWQTFRSALIEKIPFAIVAGALAVVAYIGQQKWGIDVENLSLLKRLAISAYGFCFYVWKMIFPVNLSPLYLLPPDLNPVDAKYLGCAVILIFITVVFVAFRKRWPWLLAAWLCYGLIVSPVIGLTQKGDQIAADRYTYLCLLPFSILAAAGLLRLAEKRSSLSLVIGVTALSGLGALGFLTFYQSKIWKDDFSLWQQALKVEPNNAIAHNGRGKILMDRGDFNAAMEDFNQAIELNPKIVSARNNRGMVFYNQGNLDAALADFQAALKLHPQYEIFNNCGAIYEVRGDLKKAMNEYSGAIQMNPKYAIGYFNRGRLRKREGDLSGALEDFNSAVRWDPLYADAYFRRGDVWVQKGDRNAAAQDYQMALKIAPPNWNERRAVEQRLAEAGKN